MKSVTRYFFAIGEFRFSKSGIWRSVFFMCFSCLVFASPIEKQALSSSPREWIGRSYRKNTKREKRGTMQRFKVSLCCEICGELKKRSNGYRIGYLSTKKPFRLLKRAGFLVVVRGLWTNFSLHLKTANFSSLKRVANSSSRKILHELL